VDTKVNYFSLLGEDESLEMFDLDEYEETFFYYKGKLIIVVQYILKSKEAYTQDYKFLIAEYYQASKSKPKLFKGYIHKDVP
jgi:hypothetical protein